MSGNRDFSEERLCALTEYVWSRSHMPAQHLQFTVWRSDFSAYARLGRSITGASYVKGRAMPEIEEVDADWFRRFVKVRTPWYARAIGWVLTLYLLGRSL